MREEIGCLRVFKILIVWLSLFVFMVLIVFYVCMGENFRQFYNKVLISSVYSFCNLKVYIGLNEYIYRLVFLKGYLMKRME